MLLSTTRTVFARSATRTTVSVALQLSPATALLSRPYTQSPYRMSGLEKVSTKTGPPPAAPYSQAIKANGQIWVSGQLPADENGKLVEGSITEKTRQCCKNIQSILEAGGSELGKVVRVGVFLVNMDDFKEMNDEYAKWFTHKPARTCVAVAQLPFGVKVEIEAIAIQ